MKKLYFVFFILFTFQLNAQETVKNIDSLLTLLKTTKADTAKVMLYNKIAGHYNVTSLDSSKAFSEAGIKLAEELQYLEGKMYNLNNLGNYYERKTDYKTATKYYNEALEIAKQKNSTKGFAIILNNIATIHIRKAEYDKAINLLFQALKAEEKLGNKNGIAQGYNNIGVCYYYQRNFEKTTYYLTKGLEMQEQLGNENGLINGYNNVGAIYDYQKKYDEAIKSYQKGLQISKSINDKKLEATQLFNISMAYLNKKDVAKSRKFLEQSQKIREAIQDYNGLAGNYIMLGNLVASKKNYNQSFNNFNKALKIAEQYDLKYKKQEALEGLAEASKLQKNYKKANEYLMQFIAVKDSILNEKNSKIIAEVETKYETEKKENKILSQRADLAEQKLDISKKNLVITVLMIFAAVLGLVGVFFYNHQKMKNDQLQKENELKDALMVIQTQERLENQRLRISRDLHDNIGAQLTFIISSLDNLKYKFKIPENLDERLQGIGQFTTKTIQELRDTIWAMNKDKISVFDLKSRVANFIEKAKISSDNITFNFNVKGDLDSTFTFTSIQGMNVYRIIQEAINNSVKYAEASTIEVYLEQRKKDLAVMISDDGKGFSMETVEFGHGLNNMKKRSLDLDAGFLVDSKVGKGTTIQLLIPLNTQFVV